MKKFVSLFFAIVLVSIHLQGQGTGNAVVDAILSGYSVRSYSSVPVTDQQLDLVLKCGIKAPSGRNLQPWKFTVIRDDATMKEIITDVVPGNVLIIISGVESKTGTTPDLDCGLATHSMFVGAEGLGLGARIYGGPIGNVVAKREAYQIPAGYKPVVILRIGNVDKSVDAVSAATARKKAEDVVNFKK
jgi:nitroreductase